MKIVNQLYFDHKGEREEIIQLLDLYDKTENKQIAKMELKGALSSAPHNVPIHQLEECVTLIIIKREKLFYTRSISNK
jgi:Ca2+-binding EF-hand superfamily protein